MSDPRRAMVSPYQTSAGEPMRTGVLAGQPSTSAVDCSGRRCCRVTGKGNLA